MPTVRVDDEVYAWLQSLATPFEDSPNTVLRRLAGLSPRKSQFASASPDGPYVNSREELVSAGERVTGEVLAKRWGVEVRHALYHRDGTFFENLERFPGALFDPSGYVLFKTEQEYRNSPYLRIGEKLNVPGSIASIPGYVKVA